MGMYDHIKCELTLPVLGQNSKILFCTQSLDNQRNTYRINSNGRLEKEGYLGALGYTGLITFFTTLAPEWKWLEYEAYFNNDSIYSLRLTQSQRISLESEWIVL